MLSMCRQCSNLKNVQQFGLKSKKKLERTAAVCFSVAKARQNKTGHVDDARSENEQYHCGCSMIL